MTSFEEFQYFTNVASTTINDVRFASCTKLTKIIIPDMRDHILARWFLSNCSSLKKVKVCEGNTRINGWFVNGCGQLEFVLLPSTLSSLPTASNNNQQTFLNTPAKCAYIFKPLIPPVIGSSNGLQNANGRFYVPDESVQLYKISTYWTGVAARIFPMSQLPKDKPDCPWLEELSGEGILRDYIDFEDAEVKRICCTNWGDYTEVVKTETVTEEEETVSISTVYTYVHKVNTAATRTDIKTITSSRAKTEEDEVGETSTTTIYPLGMTKAQCAAVSSLGTIQSALNTISDYNFMEFQYFTGISMNSQTLNGTSYKVMAPKFYCKSIKLPPTLQAVQNMEMIGNKTYTKKIVFSEGTLHINSCCREYSNILVDIPTTIQKLAPYIGYNATNMTVIIRKTTPPEPLDSYKTQFKPTAIYVPDESVDAYKTHSYWSYYASKFKPLSEYTG